MAERLTDKRRAAASAGWDAQAEHPFIRGIGDGSLDVERFKHWVRQDYLFLIDYARMLSLASARAPDLDAMTRLAELAHATLTTEMSLHRAYAEEFGISAEELERERPAPTCRASVPTGTPASARSRPASSIASSPSTTAAAHPTPVSPATTA